MKYKITLNNNGNLYYYQRSKCFGIYNLNERQNKLSIKFNHINHNKHELQIQPNSLWMKISYNDNNNNNDNIHLFGYSYSSLRRNNHFIYKMVYKIYRKKIIKHCFYIQYDL